VRPLVVKDDRKRLDAFLRTLAEKPTVTVGIHEAEGSEPKEVDPAVDKPTGQTLAEVATKHEFGIGTPRRSFLVDWVDANEDKIKSALRRVCKRALEVKKPRTASQALGRFGLWAVGQIQARIVSGIAPELSETRKAQKAATTMAGDAKNTPLILTGQLKAGIRSVVGSQ
jgi:hypothetical protein